MLDFANALIMLCMVATPQEDTTHDVCTSVAESMYDATTTDEELEVTTSGEYHWTLTLSNGTTLECKVSPSGTVTVYQ